MINLLKSFKIILLHKQLRKICSKNWYCVHLVISQMLSFYLTLAVLSARRRYYIVFSIKARPFQINGNYFFDILTTLAFLLKLITAKSKFAHLICLTSLIIFSPTDDSGHRSTSFCPQYFDWSTDIKFVLFIFLFYERDWLGHFVYFLVGWHAGAVSLRPGPNVIKLFCP